MEHTEQDTPPDDREARFIEQSEQVADALLASYGVPKASDLPPIRTRPASPLQPVVIAEFQNLSKEERELLRREYYSEQGVAYFVVQNPEVRPRGTHPLFDIAEQLINELGLWHPLPHPLEGHPEAVKRFGPADGTVKIYDLPGRGGAAGYREQAETNEMFAMHHDGLGSGGTVQTTLLYADAGPLYGGYTFFLNVPRLALELLVTDEHAFRSLFLPDALTIIRHRGKGAIKVTTPVLFLNETGLPQSFFRVATGEYSVVWREDSRPLQRAKDFFLYHSQPLAPGSCFLHFTHKGHGCFIRNQIVAHGRTGFADWEEGGRRRVLSRKWYMTSAAHAVYKHVPGMFLQKDYRDLYPQFGPEFLQGEWRYSQDADRNIREK